MIVTHPPSRSTSTYAAVAVSPPWYIWMQPTKACSPKSMLIHTSLPPVCGRPRHALVCELISRPGTPEKAFASSCMLSIVHRKCVHAMPEDATAFGLLASRAAIGSSLDSSQVGLARKRIV